MAKKFIATALILNFVMLELVQAEIRSVVEHLNGCLQNTYSPLNLQPRIRDAVDYIEKNPSECVKIIPEVIDQSFYQVNSALDLLYFANSIKKQSIHNAFLTFLETLTKQEIETLRLEHVVENFCSYAGHELCFGLGVEDYKRVAEDYVKNGPGEYKDDKTLSLEISNSISNSQKHIYFYTEILQNKIKKKKQITSMDISEARDEVRKTIKKQVAKMQELLADGDITTTKKDLKRLIKSNPVAVAQTLIKAGERTSFYVENLCQLIREIEEADLKQRDDGWEKAFVWGGVVVGGVLLFSGSFSAAGAGILAKAGPAALVGGAAISLGGGGYLGDKSVKAYNDYVDKKGGLLTASSDEKSLKEAEEKWNEFISLATKASLSAIFGVFDVGAFLALFKNGLIDDSLNTLKNILTDKKTKEIFRKLGEKVGPENMYSFLMLLLKSPIEFAKFLIKGIVGGGPEKAPHIVKRILDFYKKYGRELSSSPYYSRAIWKERDTSQSRNFLKNPLSWMFNPMAMLRNSKKEFTMPAQTATTIALIEMPAEIVKNNAQKMIAGQSEKVKETLSDSSLNIMSLGENGIITREEAMMTLLSHDKTLGDWLVSSDERHLPLLEELIRLKLLNQEAAKTINKLSKEAFAEAENDSSIDKKNLISNAQERLKLKIEKNKMLSEESSLGLHYINLIYDPILKINGKSNVELLHLLISDKNEIELSQLQTQSLKNIKLELLNNNLDIENALALVGKTVSQSKELEIKKVKASENLKGLLPEKMANIAHRPDFVTIKFPITYVKINGNEVEITEELDLWKILLTDPLYSDLKNDWLNNQISGKEVIDFLIDDIKNYSDVNRILNEGKKIISDESITRLIEGVPEENISSNLFMQSFVDILNTNSSMRTFLESNDRAKYLKYFTNVTPHSMAVCKRGYVEAVLSFLKKYQENRYAGNKLAIENDIKENYEKELESLFKAQCLFLNGDP